MEVVIALVGLYIAYKFFKGKAAKKQTPRTEAPIGLITLQANRPDSRNISHPPETVAETPNTNSLHTEITSRPSKKVAETPKANSPNSEITNRSPEMVVETPKANSHNSKIINIFPEKIADRPKADSLAYQTIGGHSLKTTRWYAQGESVTIQGYHIAGGMVYVGESLPSSNGYSNDASLINPKLKALPADPWEGREAMGYWPEYATIPNQCRGAYLQWLASGRSQAEAYIGYVFLFFYGLERRLLVDSQKGQVSAAERDQIVGEIQRLLTIYGDNRSFQGYANNLLAMEWVLYRNGSSPPDYLDFNNRYCLAPFQLALAQCVAAGNPLSAEMALQWIGLHPDFGLRTPARRCAKEFQALFALRYQQKFGDGLLVSANKTRLKLGYRSASPSLQGGQNLTIGDLPDPFILTAPLKKLNSLVEDCTNALDPYSRYMGRKDSDPGSLAALALLPRELLMQSPLSEKIRQYLEPICQGGPRLVSAKILYHTMGMQSPTTLGKKESETLALLLEGLGFGMAPDGRYHNAKPALGDEICIFQGGHGEYFNPSSEFRRVGTILRLGAMVSQSDQELADVEDLMLKGLSFVF